MLIIFIFSILFSLSMTDSERTQCRQFSYENPSIRSDYNNGWKPCNQYESGDLFEDMCPSNKNFGLRCARKFLKCGINGDIDLCIVKNPTYNSQYEFYELFRYLISKWPIDNFNETLEFARRLQPPNGNENGAFNALADTWLRHQYSDDYIRVKNELVKLHINERTLSCILIQLCQTLDSVELTGRVKTVYSLWNKQQRSTNGQIEHSLIADQLSVKIIVDSIADCYVVRDKIEQRFSVVRITEYIAMPKESGYQALHMIIVGLYPGQFVELQILTKDMDQIQIGNFHSQYKAKEDEFF